MKLARMKYPEIAKKYFKAAVPNEKPRKFSRGSGAPAPNANGNACEINNGASRDHSQQAEVIAAIIR